MSRFTRISSLALGATLLVLPAFAGGPQETFDQTYSMSMDGRFSLENINGDVEVEVWDRAELRIEATKTAPDNRLLDELLIEVDQNGNSISVETDYPNTSWKDRGFNGGHLEVEYRITMPRTAAISEIDLVNGDLTIVGVSGGVHAECVNGDLELKRVAGAIEASTVNGNLEIQSDGDGSDDMELSSVNGKVHLSLPSSASARIEVDTVHGRISNDFGLEVIKGEYVGRELSGTIGAGTGRIEIDNVNGGVTIARH